MLLLEHYQNIIQNEEIQKLDLSLILHNALYVIQLLSCMFHFSIEDDLLIIEKNIGIKNVTITSNEFLYLLQFDVWDEINNEFISHTKNYNDLEKEIKYEFQKINIDNIVPNDVSDYYSFCRINKDKVDELIIQKYFPKWREKKILQESIDRCDIHHIYHNYYRLDYENLRRNKIKLENDIKNISNDYKNILKYIKIYLKVKKDIL